MAWKEIDLEELAESLGTNITEVKEKQKLISMITKIRKSKKLSQAALARKLGISQARVAQIESGIGTAQVTFDILFNILIALGYDYRVITKKAA
jgi:transcriptional regulator with XRE-family HTH domain